MSYLQLVKSVTMFPGTIGPCFPFPITRNCSSQCTILFHLPIPIYNVSPIVCRSKQMCQWIIQFFLFKWVMWPSGLWFIIMVVLMHLMRWCYSISSIYFYCNRDKNINMIFYDLLLWAWLTLESHTLYHFHH